MKKLLLTICLLFVSGCCSLFVGDSQDIPITSIPSGATVKTDDGQTLVTPGHFRLKKDKDYALTTELEGFRTQTCKLERKWHNMLWLDLVWDFGIITWPIDFATRSAYEIYPKTVSFKLVETSHLKK